MKCVCVQKDCLGEQAQDRISLLHQLSSMPIHPESVPINRLVAIQGTPLENEAPVAASEMVRYDISHILVTLLASPQQMHRDGQDSDA